MNYYAHGSHGPRQRYMNYPGSSTHSYASTANSSKSYYARRGFEGDAVVVETGIVLTLKSLIKALFQVVINFYKWVESFQLLHKGYELIQNSFSYLCDLSLSILTYMYWFSLEFPAQVVPNSWWKDWSPPNDIVLFFIENILNFFVPVEVVDGFNLNNFKSSYRTSTKTEKNTKPVLSRNYRQNNGVTTPPESSSSLLDYIDESSLTNNENNLIVIYADGGVYDLLLLSIVLRIRTLTGTYPRFFVNPVLWRIPIVKQIVQYLGAVPGDGDFDFYRKLTKISKKSNENILDRIVFDNKRIHGKSLQSGSSIAIVTPTSKARISDCLKRKATIIPLAHCGFNEQFTTIADIPPFIVNQIVRNLGINNNIVEASNICTTGLTVNIPNSWRRCHISIGNPNDVSTTNSTLADIDDQLMITSGKIITLGNSFTPSQKYVLPTIHNRLKPVRDTLKSVHYTSARFVVRMICSFFGIPSSSTSSSKDYNVSVQH